MKVNMKHWSLFCAGSIPCYRGMTTRKTLKSSLGTCKCPFLQPWDKLKSINKVETGKSWTWLSLNGTLLWYILEFAILRQVNIIHAKRTMLSTWSDKNPGAYKTYKPRHNINGDACDGGTDNNLQPRRGFRRLARSYDVRLKVCA